MLMDSDAAFNVRMDEKAGVEAASCWRMVAEFGIAGHDRLLFWSGPSLQPPQSIYALQSNEIPE